MSLAAARVVRIKRWTRKEIVGRLIASASNNHRRFVRGRTASGPELPGDEQEKGVRLQDDPGARWADAIDLWRADNTHLLHVAGCMSDLAAGHRPCAECRRERFNAFRKAWRSAHPGASGSPLPTADEIDRHDRL